MGNAEACALGEQPIAIVFDLMFEGEFGSGEQTYRDTGRVLGGKARVRAIETGRDKRLANLGWTGCRGMQAIVAQFSPLVEHSRTRTAGWRAIRDRCQNITAGHSFHEMEVEWLDQVMLPA